MKSCSKNTINIFCLLILTFSLVSCSAKVENQQNTETFNKVELNTGAVIANENGTYSNYNYDNGKYKKIDNSQIIGLYNQKSGNYVGQIDGKYFSCYDDKKIDLDRLDNVIKISTEMYNEIFTFEENKIYTSSHSKFFECLFNLTLLWYNVSNENFTNEINLYTKELDSIFLILHKYGMSNLISEKINTSY